MKPDSKKFFLLATVCLLPFSIAFAQEEKEESGKDKTLSWFATGSAIADFKAQNSALSLKITISWNTET